MAAELVGGALLSAFLQVAFDRLASPDILHFFRRRRLDDTLLNNLKIKLLFINSLVDDAEQKQISNTYVQAWVDELKDAVYDAEFILDEIDYEVTKRKVEEAELQETAFNKVRNFFSASVSSFNKQVETRMRKVLEKLEYLASQKDILQLKERGGGAGFQSVVLERLPTTSLVDEAEIYGRSDDKEVIIDWMLSDNDNNQLSVISIVGMGGLGKTTLAQLVYNDQRVKDEFNIKVWICVSNEFDVLRVTRTIVEAITMGKDDSQDLNMLQNKLKNILDQKRFLLVLDDVWNENYMLWEALQTPFKYGALGSKILVTTRSDMVSSTMRSTKTYGLNQLSEEHSWSLFKRYAFHSIGDRHSNLDLEDIGRKIVKKCKGLPLALKTIGSLLYTKSSNAEWDVILKSEVWEEKSNILPSLKLSYHYLPSLIKRCFAYCSLFPKDYEFGKEHIIRLWMAENFLQCSHQSKDAREVGEQFFNVLLSRSFFQRSTEDETRFVMHDLINDLAKDVSGKFCHRMEIDKAYNLTEKTRHVSQLRNDLETSERFKDIFLAKRLHTFLPLSMHDQRQTGYFRLISRNMIHDLLSNFRCLRVLSLSGYCNNVNLPDSVGNLKHLRYLDLSGSKVKKLPDSICLLYNLQTLKLRYCELLEKLPLDLHKLINLRHLDFSETKVKEMPKKLGNLKNLQMLSSFYVGKCSETNIKQLKELNIRGAISILELQNIVYPMDAFESNFKNKMYLEELSLEWSVNNNQSQDDKDVLEKLQPHQNLKRLSIRNYGGIEFPDWLADLSLSNVVSLELSNCKNCLSLPSLGLLTSLKSLSITGFDSVVAIGPEFYGNTSCTIPFGSLRILRFKDMVGWEKWNCENVSGIFLHLQELSLENCPKLKEEFPVQLPSLEKLIIECSEHFVASVSWPPSLKVLGLNGRFTECSSTEKIESTIANTCLEDLTISNCANLEFPLCQYHNFICKMMIERSCDSLRSFPLDLFPKLRSLHLIECSNLEMISVSEGHNHKLTSLTYLAIIECPKFVSFPKGGILDPKLHTLEIRELESLKSLPRHEEGLLSNLKSLLISECPKLMASQMVWELHNHTSLAWLQIKDTNLECFPDGGLLPPNLTLLGLLHCSNLRRLGNSISHLSALKIFNLFNCPKLQYLPNEGLPSSLSNLKIDGCPLLKKRFHKQKGSDWAMTAHIPHVVIDDDLLA